MDSQTPDLQIRQIWSSLIVRNRHFKQKLLDIYWKHLDSSSSSVVGSWQTAFMFITVNIWKYDGINKGK